MLTADCVAAFLVHCVLWAAWAWLYATSIAQVLTLATAPLLVGLLLSRAHSSGPHAGHRCAHRIPYTGAGARVAATAATCCGQSPVLKGAKAPQSKNLSARRTRVLNCGVCAFAALAFPRLLASPLPLFLRPSVAD